MEVVEEPSPEVPKNHEQKPEEDLDSIKKTLSKRGTDVVSPDKPMVIATPGFMENLQAEHEKVETIGFIEASALKNIVENQQEPSNTNQPLIVTTSQPTK